ncbi:hypothetical protein LOD99_9819 [Oopsacas minuta]|uniref:Paired domain-containing protein n=1 Tax=Oopsacas minuta TaxID=111878 RepID=A0AAV7KK33_9METZ|nr:hypothetical protein LOD99_9819 [Oopsacas minuta]
MESKRSAVIQLFEAGNTKSQIVRLLKTNKMFISRTLSRYNDTGSIADRTRPGRPRTVRTFSVTKNVSQRIRRNPSRSIRKMAKEMNTNRESMRRLVRNDLGMKAYKLRKRQFLTQLNKQKRLKRCKAKIFRFTDGRHKQIFFSDEKLFTVNRL